MLIDLGCFPDIWYHIMCGTRNHRKQGYSIILGQNAHVNFFILFHVNINDTLKKGSHNTFSANYLDGG